jgi:hypothetical protein
MKNVLIRFLRLNDTTVPLENKLSDIVTFGTFVSVGIGLIQNIIIGIHWLVNSMLAATMLVSAFCFYFSRFKNLYREIRPYFLSCIGVFLSISWFVNYITDDGFIHVIRNGGSDHLIAPAKRVFIHKRHGGLVEGVFGWPAIHTRTDKDSNISPALDNITIDIGAKDRDEVLQLGVHVGCVITYQDEFTVLNDRYYVGRALDNRMGGFCIAEVARLLKENNIKLPYSLYVVNSVQELWPQSLPQHFHNLILRVFHHRLHISGILQVRKILLNNLAAHIAGHDNNGVFEVHYPSFIISKPSIV